jgi:tape measure domain-containing protein
MAIKDSVLNIVLRAKDLTKGALTKFRSNLKGVDDQANRTAGGGLKRLALGFTALIASIGGFFAVRAGLFSILKTGDQFERLGIQLSTMMGSVAEGERAFAWVREFTKETPLQLSETTEAFVKLKASGIDPMNGSLQALVDQNEALGGGTERLNGLILAVGKAYSRGKIEAEEWNQFTERGVGISALFSEALGKTEQEIIAMRTAGRLGREEIAKLLETMGEKNAGAAAASMSTLTGLVSNLKDSWEVFLNTIATSGILDLVREKLQGLAASIVQLQESGDLATYAKGISDGLVTMVNALIDAGKFVGKFSAELALLAKAFVLIKTAKLIAGIAGVAKGMVIAAANTVIFSKASTTATVAVGKLQGAFLLLQAFLVGWEIGTYLRGKFLFIEKLSNNLVGGMLKSWATLQHGWDLIVATISGSDKLMDAAQARYKAKIDEISESTRILNEAAQASADKLAGVADEAGKAVGTIIDVTKAAAAAVVVTTDLAAEKLKGAFATLEVEAEKVETGISNVGRAAIDAFGKVVEAERELGRETKVVARSIQDSFINAFKAVETEAGKKELLTALKGAVDKGLISMTEYKKVLAAAGTEATALAEKLGHVAREADKAADSVRKVGNAGKEAGDDAAAGASRTGSAIGLVTDAIAGYTAVMSALGERSRAAWVDMVTGVRGAGEVIDDFGSKLKVAQDRLRDLGFEAYRVFDATGLRKALLNMATSAEAIKIQFYEQQVALQSLTGSYADASISAEEYIRKGEQMLRTSNLLNDQDISGLTSGIEAAKRAMDSLNDSAQNTLDGLQTELDRLNGDTAAIEQRQFQKRITDLEASLEEAKEAKNQDAIADLEASLRIAKEIYTTENKNRAEAERARRAKQEQQNLDQSKQQATTQPASGNNNNASAQKIELQLNNESANISTDNPDSLLDLLSEAGFRTS